MMAARFAVGLLILQGAWAATCPDDPESDLCDTTEVSGAVRSQSLSTSALLLAGVLGCGGRISAGGLLLLPLAFNAFTAEAATPAPAPTCGGLKAVYKDAACCGSPTKSFPFQVVPKPDQKLFKNNYCSGKKPVDATPGDKYFNNVNCTLQDGVLNALEQAGANVTKGYVGGLNAAGRTPILTDYLAAGLCPVNVHWHLGTEHLSMGEFDENGKGPAKAVVHDDHGDADSRRLATEARMGYRCHHYNANDAKFTTPYKWQHCVEMKVGETYEVHWPHSAAGACGTPYQYQTPFYDGVFCKGGIITLSPLNTYMKIGVQSQIFTIVNDENYYYPDLFRGMIVDGDFGKDIGKYTGSTTGTSRNNEVCSRYTPITWQVDRKCHLISASSFDKMCADMKQQADDMSDDLHAHGSRMLVSNKLAANNLQRRVQGLK
jgi:hypothetical protein